MTNEKKTAQQLKFEIAEANQRDIDECGKAINETLKKFECTLRAAPVLTTDGRIAANVILGKGD